MAGALASLAGLFGFQTQIIDGGLFAAGTEADPGDAIASLAEAQQASPTWAMGTATASQR